MWPAEEQEDVWPASGGEMRRRDGETERGGRRGERGKKG